MPTSANTPDQRSDRYARYIQVGPRPATHLSRWVHPNGTTKSHPPPSIVKALTPSQLADTPSSPLPHKHAHLGRAIKTRFSACVTFPLKGPRQLMNSPRHRPRHLTRLSDEGFGVRRTLRAFNESCDLRASPTDLAAHDWLRGGQTPRPF